MEGGRRRLKPQFHHLKQYNRAGSSTLSTTPTAEGGWNTYHEYESHTKTIYELTFAYLCVVAYKYLQNYTNSYIMESRSQVTM
jgi:hypothetical protein